MIGSLSGACSPGEKGEPEVTVQRPSAMPSTPAMTAEAPAPALHEATANDLMLVEAPPPPSCGDGKLNDDEQCDDGNKQAGDGCSANCLVVEQGYACSTAGAECVPAAICGDGVQFGAEQCDDGNGTGGDGCSTTCQLERDFACPTPGKPCLSSVRCGDGRVAGDEKCDDGNAVAGDGCSDTCAIETGYACPPGGRCAAVCGDGLVLGAETCDDGNTDSDDGCSSSCGREGPFACNTPGQACTLTRCGDGVPEGNEGCDDRNQRPFDGCFQCVSEPECTGGECAAVCGDGLRFTSEACDDGNQQNGDGCSDTCEIEPGFACLDQGGTGATGDSFVLPVIYRDFVGTDTSGPGQTPSAAAAAARTAAGVRQHPDFNVFVGTGVLGAVQPQLGADGLPVFACGNAAAPGCAAVLTNFTSAANFNQWYRDTNGVNLPVVDQLVLGASGGGAFLFDSAAGTSPATISTQFDPLLDKGFQARIPALEGKESCLVLPPATPGAAPATPTADPGQAGATPRNMSFTTETRFVFEYGGGETFAFSGDDDVWVFMNNRLLLDLGGLHEVATGEFELDANGFATVVRTGPAGSALTSAAPIRINTGMVIGRVYEAVLFHAERHECGSNFKLTLAGFDKPRSVCREVCGDGVATRSESCDDGPLNGSGYGACAADCSPGPHCGDALVNGGGEVCDNGVNVDRYSTSPSACGPGCTRPSFCGDKVVDTVFGERCDDGVNDNSYGGCSDTCGLGPRCGDGMVNGGGEECDDGNRINGDGCNLSCRFERSPA